MMMTHLARSVLLLPVNALSLGSDLATIRPASLWGLAPDASLAASELARHGGMASHTPSPLFLGLFASGPATAAPKAYKALLQAGSAHGGDDIARLIKDIETGDYESGLLTLLLDLTDLATAGKMDDDDRADRTVINALSNKDPRVREQAAHFLGVRRCSNAADGLRNLLNDDDVEVRIAAATSLGDIGDTRSIERLTEISQTDPDSEVREAALFAIKVIRDPSKNISLQDLLQDLRRLISQGKKR